MIFSLGILALYFIYHPTGMVPSIATTPPLWQATWFRLLTLALLLVLGYIAYRWRVRGLRARNLELAAEVAGMARALQEEIATREATEARLQRTRDELATIMAMSQDMVSTLDVDALLTLILDQLKRVVDYGGAAVLTRIDDVIMFRAYRGTPLGFDTEDFQIPVLEVQVMRQAIHEQQPFIVDDLTNEPALLQELSTAMNLPRDRLFGNARCWMGLPMIIGDNVVGLLGIIHGEAGYYDEADLGLAQAFANQAALAIENAQLYEQAQAAAAAEERNRLARDLHDSVTQTLFSVSVMAETTPQVMRRNSDDGWRNLEKLRLMTKGALAEMRTLLLELRPDAITQMPLEQLLSVLADSTFGRSRTPVELVVDGDFTPPEDVKVVLYRVAQEALNNMVKHANATEARVVLESHPDEIKLTICDNGCGFQPGGSAPGHFGLAIMEERVASIHGVLDINSVVNRGTDITISWQQTGSNAHD